MWQKCIDGEIRGDYILRPLLTDSKKGRVKQGFCGAGSFTRGVINTSYRCDVVFLKARHTGSTDSVVLQENNGKLFAH